MQITRKRLRRIIKEEVSRLVDHKISNDPDNPGRNWHPHWDSHFPDEGESASDLVRRWGNDISKYVETDSGIEDYETAIKNRVNWVAGAIKNSAKRRHPHPSALRSAAHFQSEIEDQINNRNTQSEFNPRELLLQFAYGVLALRSQRYESQCYLDAKSSLDDVNSETAPNAIIQIIVRYFACLRGEEGIIQDKWSNWTTNIFNILKDATREAMSSRVVDGGAYDYYCHDDDNTLRCHEKYGTKAVEAEKERERTAYEDWYEDYVLESNTGRG